MIHRRRKFDLVEKQLDGSGGWIIADITEEQVRLSAHLNYLLETMKTDAPNGKKLVFISQEIGREINTIGSKSSDAEMQKIVVQMKDELEKIKEQLLNIL